MKSIREQIEGFAYPFLENILNKIDKEGEKSTLGGFKFKIDEQCFALGLMIKCSVMLYLKEKDSEKSKALCERLLRFFDLIDKEKQFGTWGKQFLLEALVMLKKAEKLCILSEEKISILEEKTDYSDFFDKDEIKILDGMNLPTNYYHVALSCAVQREFLGFENDGISRKIAEKLLGIMKDNSDSGWMDEVPPRGRFDSYSLHAYSDVYKAFCEIGMKDEIPTFITENLREAALINFSMRNRKGHGFSYGRSLSVYGDKGTLMDVIFCIKNGLVSGEEKEDAIAYCISICDRLLNFWFRKEDNFFDIWTSSRKTDCYRGPDVILTLQLGVTMTLIGALEEFTLMGLDNYVPKENVSLPEKWEARKTVFENKNDKVRVLYVLRRGEHTFSLPFVGMSDKPNTVNDAYFAFPHEQEFIEEPVWMYHPFLVPEIVTEDGRTAILMEDFKRIEERYEDDKITVSVSGRLVGKDTEPTDIGFDGTYIFEGSKITVFFNIHKPYTRARMLFSGAKTDHVCFIGAAHEEISDVSENRDYFACCGGIKECKTAYFTGEKIGYEITL